MQALLVFRGGGQGSHMVLLEEHQTAARNKTHRFGGNSTLRVCSEVLGRRGKLLGVLLDFGGHFIAL